MKIKIIRFGNYIVTPERAHHNDSGADVFASEDCIIYAHSVAVIPTGIGLELPDGYDAVLHCRSSLSSRGIFCANAPIDAGYRGEIFAILYNNGEDNFRIFAGNKIAQIVVRPVVYADFVDELGDERGDGAFGSTGM